MKIDDNGSVTRADTTDTENPWYSYANQKWANAVILTEEGKIEADGSIKEESIESYFVWIPKYSYKLWDLGDYKSYSKLDSTKVHAIDIKFGTTNTTDSKSGECTTPMNSDNTQGLSGEKGQCEVGDYMTHPAFISFGVNGLWVGKFETGYKDAISTASAQITPTSESDAISKVNEVVIKPDEYSWRSIQPAYSHLVSYNYERSLDSHMMKNTEWGAVAYLSHSIYGTCSKEKCQEVVKNNASDYKTGYAAINPPTTGEMTYILCSEQPDACNEYGPSTNSQITTKWNTANGKRGSTSGNIYGIYDMSGGAFEATMTLTYDKDNKGILVGANQSATTGFKGKYGSPKENEATEATTGVEIPDKKYYDIYNYSTSNSSWNRRILGDATGEMGPFQSIKYTTVTYYSPMSSWYNDDVWMPAYFKPNYVRGGIYYVGINGGVFRGNDYNGEKSTIASFRIVLAF